MDLYMTRRWFTPNTTISILTLPQLRPNGRNQIYILEDADRGLTHQTPLRQIQQIKNQFPNACAIPTGRYPLQLEYSPKFGRILIELQAVRGFNECKFHNGNTALHTAGCLITGLDRGIDTVRFSLPALDYLHRVLMPIFEQEAVFLNITRENNALSQ